MQAVLTLFKKYWPQILAGITALWGVYGSTIVNLIYMHPKILTVASCVAVALAHLVRSPLQNPPSISETPPKTTTLSMIMFCAFLGLGLIGCSEYKDAVGAVNVIGQIVTIAENDLPALTTTGTFNPTEAISVQNYLQLVGTLNTQTGACLTAAGTSAKAAAISACFSTFSAGLSSPTELALLRVLNPKAQAKVQLWVTAVILAVNSILGAVGSPPAVAPTITAEQPDMRDLAALRTRLAIAGQ